MIMRPPLFDSRRGRVSVEAIQNKPRMEKHDVLLVVPWMVAVCRVPNLNGAFRRQTREVKFTSPAASANFCRLAARLMCPGFTDVRDHFLYPRVSLS